MRTDIKELEKILQYEFRKPELLEKALTHSSYANDVTGSSFNGNERLEFLGDSILDAVVSVFLYSNYEKAEGDMTRVRAAVVCEKSLAAVSRRFGLWEFLRLGRGEESTGGRTRDSIIADGVEAIIGAVFLDGGVDAASKVVSSLMKDSMDAALAGRLFDDYKTAFQEAVQKNGPAEIKYVLVSESGPDHAKVFECAVRVNGREAGRGRGNSKKQAEQAAAKAAVMSLGER